MTKEKILQKAREKSGGYNFLLLSDLEQILDEVMAEREEFIPAPKEIKENSLQNLRENSRRLTPSPSGSIPEPLCHYFVWRWNKFLPLCKVCKNEMHEGNCPTCYLNSPEDSGSDKPDGWALMDENNRILNYFFDEDEAKEHLDEFPQHKHHWQIRPVKLQFLDTPQGGKDE